MAFSSLAASLNAPVRVVGYGLGVAAGTLIGLYVDEWPSRGTSEIQLVVHGDDGGLLERLRALGWPATSFPGEGPRGSVTVAFVAVDDTQVRHVNVLEQSVPDAFWTVQQLRNMHASPFGKGPALVSALDRSPRRYRHRPTHSETTHIRQDSDVHRTPGAAA